jgi:hypothetical protein
MLAYQNRIAERLCPHFRQYFRLTITGNSRLAVPDVPNTLFVGLREPAFDTLNSVVTVSHP